jgi:hypothetical protein
MNMIGNSKLKKIAAGWLKIALKLAFVIAQSAFDWLYFRFGSISI